ncbi:unnamed protein product [Auanema sp. JU1783]|nr:unnamed protein product [Auanema sp. JU1783]
MKVRVKPKYECGSAVTYISRQQAMKKLQLSMRDFRRLCILKGIYPHVPHNKKKANKGTSDNKVFYYRKDINFLAHEPIIGKFREYKVFLKKFNKLKAKKEDGRIKVLHDNKPTYSLDHIVKERYPTFASALRDLDDALSLVFVFSTLPYTKILKLDIINDCRRLSAEFMHYVIEAQALRNVFISIKGIYYQAEICGEKITWLVPHERGNPHVTDVDFAVLTTFSEFYVAMLGFVNYRLFATQGLHYPPKIETGTNVVEEANDEEIVEKIYSLSKPIARKSEQPTEQDDDVQVDIFGEEDNALAEKIKQIKAIKSLFKGCVFYLNRETPREALTLIIRSCGGTVGWEGSANNITETDAGITHHIVDRPLKNVDINRRYLQPQWVFDCLNARRLLPANKYLPGATLPPHFSPFISEKPGDYIPVERLEELRNLGKDVESLVANEPIIPTTEKKPKKKPEEPVRSGMRAELGRMHKKNKQLALNQQGSDNKMKEMMLARKHQRVYHSMKTKLKKDKNEALKLKTKRAKIDKEKPAARV